MHADQHLVTALSARRHSDAARLVTADATAVGHVRVALGHALVRLGHRLSGVSPGPRHA